MTFDEILDQAIEMLQRRGRLTYRALQRQFNLDDAYLEDLKDELIEGQRLATDENGKVLVWASEGGTPSSDREQTSERSATEPGASVRIESPPPEPPTPDAERRQLTVMFCDLAESTHLSGQLDPEDLRDVIRGYQATSAEVIERYDGYIAQHLGDGLMVYFGWPQAHEDDAQRAVHAGLGIIEAMGQLNARLEQDKGIRLAVRIGIHTGLVVVGEIGQGARQEHLALGETPNVASRIEGIAAPDTVAISEATYQLVQGYFVCKELGQHALKGVGEPQQVYRVVSGSGAQSRLDVSFTRGLTPLVGREQEVGLLLERWQQVKDGQGQVVLLSGEAGIGKSRLLQVLKEHVAGEAHMLLECRSSPYYQNTTLYPITDMLQRVLNWQHDDHDTHEAKLDTLEQLLRQHGLELEETVPLLAALLSLPLPEDRHVHLNLSPQRQREKTLETIVALLVQQTEAQPVLFILEDLHWTDPSTLEFLELLIDQTPTTSICVLLTSRPAFQPPWSMRSYLTQVTLNHLFRGQIEHMAERVAGGKRLPAEVLQQIVEKTDGVPLFVEEMTKAILESGMLQEANAHYELAGSFTTLAIPTTLQGSLMARLDHLVTAKAVAQYAAVIGRQFSYALLVAVAQLDEATLQRELGRLVEAELLYQRGLPSQATYVFKHALIQDTAYESLLKSTRQQYHHRIAQVLEEHFPETVEAQPELLAYHYTEADLVEQAIGYWQQAGQRAIQRSANVEAIAHLQQGIELLGALPDTPERIQQELIFQTTLGPALLVTKGQGSPDVLQTYARARELCEQVGEPPQLFQVLRGLWYFHLLRAEFQKSRELGEELLTLAQDIGDLSLRLEAHYALGNTLNSLGEFVTAQTHLAQCIGLYNPQKHREHALRYGQDPGVASRAYAAMTLWFVGYPDQAEQQSQETQTLARNLRHPFSLAYALIFAALLHQLRREGDPTHERAAAAISLATEHRFSQFVGLGTILQGLALGEQSAEHDAGQGQVQAGLAQIQQGLGAFRATGAETIRPYFLAQLAAALVRVGRHEDGLTLLDEGLTVTNHTEERRWEAELYRLKGDLLLRQAVPDAAQAEACFNQSLDVARQQQAKSWELRAATSLARLWQSQGKRQDAYDLLAPVYEWFTEGFDTADLRDAKGLLDELG